MIKVKMYYVQK